MFSSLTRFRDSLLALGAVAVAVLLTAATLAVLCPPSQKGNPLADLNTHDKQTHEPR